MFEKLLQIKPGSSEFTIATKALIRNFREHGVGYAGGQIAYFLILSLFPFLIFINALIASFNIPALSVIQFLEPFFPEQIISLIAKYIEYISQNRGISLLSFGIILAVFSASKAVRSLVNAFNNAYNIPPRRGFFAQLLFSMLFIFVFGVIVLICIMLVAFGNESISGIIDKISVSFAFIDLLAIWRWATISLIMFLIISVMYKLLPDKKIKYKDTLPGTLLALAGFIVLTSLFSLYVNNFMVTSALYGSIGAVILLLLWAYFAGTILVLGAELNNICEMIRKKQ